MRLTGPSAMGLWLALSLVSLWPGVARALEVPALRGRVNDLAELLKPAERAALESKLEAYERGSGHQFALLTVAGLEGDNLEDFSIRVVEQWKLGKRGQDDGLLVVVAKADRQMRIEVGYGLEGNIPDAIAARIVREVMQPAFRAGDFHGGIDRAFDMLMRAAGGERVLPPHGPSAHEPSEAQLLFWGAIVLFWVLMTVLGSRGGHGRRRATLLGTGLGGGFGGGLGGGRGGFGGGGGFSGGGGFGGGGASGGW